VSYSKELSFGGGSSDGRLQAAQLVEYSTEQHKSHSFNAPTGSFVVSEGGVTSYYKDRLIKRVFEVVGYTEYR
jgi:hypothetical protein